MIKLINPSSYNFDDPIASVVPYHSRGIDTSFFTKRASSGVSDQFRSITPKDSNHSLIHLIAMGATDSYGYNRNGDGFFKYARDVKGPQSNWKELEVADGSIHKKSAETYTERTDTGLADRYKTFATHGNVFRNHKNKPARGDKIYGSIKAAAYNDPMDRVELMIEVPNDEWASDLHKLANDEQIPYSMACFVNPKIPVLTDKGYKGIADIVIGDLVYTHRGNWKRVKALNRRTYSGRVASITLKDMPLVIDVTEDHLWMASISKKHSQKLQLASSSNIDDLSYIPVADGGATWVHSNHLISNDYLMLNNVDKFPVMDPIPSELTYLAYELGYITGSGGLPSSVQIDLGKLLGPYGRGVYLGLYGSSDELKLCWLAGLIDSTNGSVGDYVTWTDTDFRVALEVRDLCISAGIYAKLTFQLGTMVDNDGAEITIQTYQVLMPKEDCKDLIDMSDRLIAAFEDDQILVNETQEYHESFYIPQQIKAITYTHVTDITVYNIEVEDDHSYTVAGIVSHNCYVPYDICSECNHKGKNRKEYCSHLTNSITDLTKQGNVVGAINDHQTFFDISRVNRPADRIAWSLVKSAGTLLDEVGANYPDLEEYPDLGVISSSVPLETAKQNIELLQKLAVIEKQVPMMGQKAITKARGIKSLQACKNLDALAGKHEKLAYVMKALIDNDVLLPLDKFAQLILGNHYEKAAAHIATATSYLPNLFSLAIKQDNIEKVACIESYNPSYITDLSLHKIASSSKLSYGIGIEECNQRLISRSIRSEGMVLVKYASSDDNPMTEAAQQLLNQYAAYKLAYVANRDVLDTNYLENIVIHNFTQ